MTVHIIKLFVGLDTLSEIAAWQARHLEDTKRMRRKPELMHVTRTMPKRAEDVLDGGSLYWVIDGWIAARQRLLELRPVVRDGIPHCGLVYDKEIVTVRERPHRPFQGWRYLAPEDAPPDTGTWQPGRDDMPDDMRRELRSLGLL